MPTLTGPRRSEVLQALLERQRQPNQAQTGLEAGLRLAAAALRQKQINKLQGQESEANRRLAEALSPVQQFEQIANLPGDAVQAPAALTPQRKPDSAVELAIASLPPEQQAAAFQLMQARKEAFDPSDFEKAKTLQDDRIAAADRQQERQIEANVQASEVAHAHRVIESLNDAELDTNRLFTEQRISERLIAMQHENDVELEKLKGELDLKTLSASAKDGLKERQGKATAWLISAQMGNQIMEEMLEGGFKVDPKWRAAYEKSINEDTGVFNRVLFRELVDQETANFFDAAHLFVDGAIRQSTGAAVKDFEFTSMIASLIPLSEDPQEIMNKAAFRRGKIEGFMGEAGQQGVDIARRAIERANVPPQNLNDQPAQTTGTGTADDPIIIN